MSAIRQNNESESHTRLRVLRDVVEPGKTVGRGDTDSFRRHPVHNTGLMVVSVASSQIADN